MVLEEVLEGLKEVCCGFRYVLNWLRGVCVDLRWCTICFGEVFEGFRED